MIGKIRTQSDVNDLDRLAGELNQAQAEAEMDLEEINARLAAIRTARQKVIHFLDHPEESIDTEEIRKMF
jgi:hypothetical protein